MKILIVTFLLFSGVSCYAQDDPLLSCMASLVADPRFAPIADKVALNSAPETTFAMLANTTFPNDTEKKAISEWAEARSACAKAGEDYWKKNYPLQFYALGIESENKIMASGVDLYNKKISFGTFNKQRQAIADEMRNKVVAIVQQILSEREAKQQALQQARDAQAAAQQRDDAARRQAQYQYEQAQQAQDIAQRRQLAMQLFLNNMRPPQQFQPMQPYQMPIRPSVNTNCSQVGNQWNCTTR